MLRQTRQRASILRFLKNHRAHPTADMVYEGVRKEIPNISIGTVYRNLKVLQESGMISGLKLKGTVTRYEGNTENHYHFRCDKCGGVSDIYEPVDKSLNEKISRKTGLMITRHQLEFRGLCKKCQQENEGGT